MKSSSIFLLVLMSSALLLPAGASANLLLNPSFETGGSMPNSWNTYGSGSYIYRTDTSHTGSKCMELGGSPYALMYQRVAGTAGETYEVRTWAKLASGSGSATLKIEFHNSGEGKIVEYQLPFFATGSWVEHSISNVAPENTYFVTSSVVGEAGGTVLFDDVTIELTGPAPPPEPDTVTYDISNTSHEFLGFGAHIWGYGNTPAYPNLLSYRQQALEELNIKYVRIENYAEYASWADMQATRAITDALGIKWVYMIWVAPGGYSSGGWLSDVSGFATWWKNHVANLYNNGIPVEYIELMNEPDSMYISPLDPWSTGITYSDYNLLVKDLRSKLDTAGYSDVGIVGAGPAAIEYCDDYMYALDPTGVAAMSAWSTHSWGTVDGPGSESRAVAYLKVPGDAVDATLPKFVTEYATHQTTFHGVTSPPGDNYGTWDAAKVFPYYATSNRQPYAVRTYENTLGLLNGGANAPFLWQLIDEPTETITASKRKAWGGLDLWGNPKPVYGALKTLYPKIPVGSMVVTAPDQSSNQTYTGVYTYNNRIVIGITNELAAAHVNTITLTNAPENLKIVEAIGFDPNYWGDHTIGEPDIGMEVAKTLTLNTISATSYSIDPNMPRDSTLTVVLTVKPDFDANGNVESDDLSSMARDWLQGANATDIAPGEGDGQVNYFDFALLKKHWQN